MEGARLAPRCENVIWTPAKYILFGFLSRGYYHLRIKVSVDLVGVLEVRVGVVTHLSYHQDSNEDKHYKGDWKRNTQHK